MASSPSRLRVAEINGVTKVEFLDRNILDEANIQQIGEEIGRIVDGKVQPKLLVSFANVDHLSSAALGTLITLRHKVDSKDGQLRLSDIKPQIHSIFVITKLTKLFQIHDSAAEAMKSFA
ncbi:MAG: STAS domain-containing protein [Phycisphaerales bacterium]|jgi:anti-anti-sigma factor